MTVAAKPAPTQTQHLLAEFVGTTVLLATVIGSGIMAERLAAGNAAVALLGNTLATCLVLWLLIEMLAPVSGAHFNPVVTLVMWRRRQLSARLAVLSMVVQFAGAGCGAMLAHAMFELPLLQSSGHVRWGWGQWIAEAVATAGLLLAILRAPPAKVALAVAAWIGAAYWFTASTSFANPAAAFGRMLTESFSGISPASVPPFVLAQCFGALLGVLLHRALSPD